MKKAAAILFPVLLYGAVAAAGRFFTAQGMPSWYGSLAKPAFTPPGSLIAVIWTVVCILSALSPGLFINASGNMKSFVPIFSLYILNGIINIFSPCPGDDRSLPSRKFLSDGLPVARRQEGQTWFLSISSSGWGLR